MKDESTSNVETEKISRLDFLNKTYLGALGLLLIAKSTLTTTNAATTVKDNLAGGGGGVCIGNSAPANKSKLWIDTSHGGRGVMKYWNGSAWSATASVWDD